MRPLDFFLKILLRCQFRHRGPVVCYAGTTTVDRYDDRLRRYEFRS
jgi:hypothetical protein